MTQYSYPTNTIANKSQPIYYSCAETAKFVREALKESFPGVKFGVTSKSYSMGASIRVTWFDGPTTKQVDSAVYPFVGSYSSDAYGGDPIKMGRDDTVDPKTGKPCRFAADYIHTDRNYSESFLRAELAKLCAQYRCPLPEIKISSYDNSAYIESHWDWIKTYNLPDDLCILLRNKMYEISLCDTVKKEKRIRGVLTAERGTLEGESGWWIGGDTWPNQRMIKQCGGQWNKAQVKYWLADAGMTDGTYTNESTGITIQCRALPEPIADMVKAKSGEELNAIQQAQKAQRLAIKFRELADNLQKQIDEKSTPRTWNATARRNRMDASRADDVRHLKLMQDKLRALAAQWEAGTLPELLQDVATKAQVNYILTYEKYYGSRDELKNCNLDNEARYLEARRLLLAMGNPDAGQKTKAEQIREMEREISLSKIDGFFPTPRNIAADMVIRADIRDGMTVLEPSAGAGHIADTILDITNGKTGSIPAMPVQIRRLDVIEVCFSLRDLLELKGYTPRGFDFLEFDGAAAGGYDRIIMNPPFEDMADIDHVMHAYECLKPGGRLVSIMSESAFFRSTRKAQDFQRWLDEKVFAGDAEVWTLPEKSFMSSDRPTGVNTRMIAVDKPAEDQPGSNLPGDAAPDGTQNDDQNGAITEGVPAVTLTEETTDKQQESTTMIDIQPEAPKTEEIAQTAQEAPTSQPEMATAEPAEPTTESRELAMLRAEITKKLELTELAYTRGLPILAEVGKRRVYRQIIAMINEAWGMYYAAIQISGGKFIYTDFPLRAKGYTDRAWNGLGVNDSWGNQ